MFYHRQPGQHSGLNVLIALSGAVLINLLLMVLIPWLFRGSSGQRELPQRIKEPIFVAPAEVEQESAQARFEPEPQPEIELPEPPPEVIKPLLSPPEINPEIKFSKVKVDAQIESELTLNPLPETLSTPVTNIVKREFYRIGEVDREPVSHGRMEPVYPFLARRRGIEGSVKVRFFVTLSGRVTGLEIVKAEPVGFFEKAVRQTVSNWRFQPGMVAGIKVKTLVETTIVFKLDR